MNTANRSILCTSALAFLVGAAVPASAAPVDCAKAGLLGDKRACEAAARGAADLRQFVQRTRGVYILSIRDFEAAVPASSASLQERPIVAKVG